MTVAIGDQALLRIALDLSASLPSKQLYQRILQALCQVFPCDAVALMLKRGEQLELVALHGLAPELIGQRFDPAFHPRLAEIQASRSPVRFPAHSPLPDPFDGQLATDPSRKIDVHACMGCSLYVEDTLVGVLTLDALQPGAFDVVDDVRIATFSALAAAAIRNATLLAELEQAREQQQAVAQELVQEAWLREGELVGESEAFAKLQRELQLVATSDLSVLITGETGTGKELVARTIHARSNRANSPLVYVNCAALPVSLAESELFGHVKGAFTGAIANRKGKFELADGGTLFLDEIGELPLELQSKLLRALQQGEIQQVGAEQLLHVDVRVIAATNRQLEREVAQGRFRADLYHRLRVFPVEVPPLRQRKADLPVLCGQFLQQAQGHLGGSPVSLHPAAMEALMLYDWPGNVRELEHLLMRAAIRARRSGESRILILKEHLALPAQLTEGDENREVQDGTPVAVQDAAPPAGQDFRAAVESYQRQLIRAALERHDGVWAHAASALNLDRGNLYRMGQRLGLVNKADKP